MLDELVQLVMVESVMVRETGMAVVWARKEGSDEEVLVMYAMVDLVMLIMGVVVSLL